MADKIEPNAPRGPQNRKQIQNEAGQFVPVPEEAPAPKPVHKPKAAPRELIVGDAVTLSGRVLEIHSTQGGRVSVKVQLPSGAVWLQSDSLRYVPEAVEDKALKGPPENK